jgi:N4-gp56 family major capsid protein
MAKYSIATNSPNAVKLWTAEVIREVQLEEFFAPMTGKDGIVKEINELEKKKGDAVSIPFTSRLQGDGVEDDAQLEDNEERMVDYSDQVSLKLYRHAVRDEGELHRKRPMFSVTEEQKALLSTWIKEKIEGVKLNAVLGAFSSTVYNATNVLTLAANETAARTAMHASNTKITPQFLSQLSRYARTGGLSGTKVRNFEPLEPVTIGGQKYLVLLCNHEVTYDMKFDTTFFNATKDARERSKDNPLFNMADIIWDGIIVIPNERVPAFNDGGGSTVHYSRAVLLGKMGLFWAWGSRVASVTKDFDYDDEIGVAMKFVAGCKKPSKNSKDYGSLGVYLSSTKIG